MAQSLMKKKYMNITTNILIFVYPKNSY